MTDYGKRVENYSLCWVVQPAEGGGARSRKGKLWCDGGILEDRTGRKLQAGRSTSRYIFLTSAEVLQYSGLASERLSYDGGSERELGHVDRRGRGLGRVHDIEQSEHSVNEHRVSGVRQGARETPRGTPITSSILHGERKGQVPVATTPVTHDNPSERQLFPTPPLPSSSTFLILQFSPPPPPPPFYSSSSLSPALLLLPLFLLPSQGWIQDFPKGGGGLMVTRGAWLWQREGCH